MSGRVSGCLRVTDLPPGAYHVTLDGVLSRSSYAAGQAKQQATGGATAVPKVVSLALSPTSGAPGTAVTVTGRLASAVAKPASHVYLCFDDCRDGLQYEGVPATWASPTEFHASLVVPSAPWIERGPARLEVPKTQGVPIGVQCLSVTQGCGLLASEAHATFHLQVHNAATCAEKSACASLRTSPARAAPGDVVRVRGFAPISSVIGSDHPFVFQLHVARGPASGPEVRFLRNSKLGSTVVSTRFGHAALTVVAAPSFAGLGHLHLEGAAQLDAVSPISANPADPAMVAWCEPGKIDLSTSGTASVSSTISTKTATTSLDRAGLATGNEPNAPVPCQQVALPAGHPASAMAAFTVNPHGQAPPFALVGMVSTDNGNTWAPVPVPPGASETTFGGFRYQGAAVLAVFGPSRSAVPTPGSVQAPLVEATTDGGLHWHQEPFSCPASGPCVSLASYQPGNCAMNGSAQPILRSPDAGGSWTSPQWPQSVQACEPAELVPGGTHTVLLVDSSSPYPLLRSTDAGKTWSVIGLPPIPANHSSVAGNGAFGPGQGGVVLLPDGSMLAWVTNGTTTQRTSWNLLLPRGHRWCPAAASLRGSRRQVTTPPLVLGQRLWWGTVVAVPAGGPSVTAHEVPLSHIRC